MHAASRILVNLSGVALVSLLLAFAALDLTVDSGRDGAFLPARLAGIAIALLLATLLLAVLRAYRLRSEEEKRAMRTSEEQFLAERTRVEDELRADRERLKVIIATQQAIGEAGLDLQGVMNLVAERTQMLTGADAGIVELVEGDALVYRAASGTASPYIGKTLSNEAGLTSLAARSGEVLRCDDSETDTRVDRDTCRQLNVRSMLIAPLNHDGQTIGVLKVLSARVAAFGDRDVDTLQLMTGLIAAAVSHAAQFEMEQALVAERTTALAAVEEREERFRILFDRSPDGIVLLDPHDPDVPYCIVSCNQAEAVMHGYTQEELIGQPINLLTGDPMEIDEDDEYDEYLEDLRHAGVVLGDDIHYRKDGSSFPMEYSTSVVMMDGRELVLGIDRDITERKLYEAQLQHQALHDPLTELPNRALLTDRLTQSVLVAEREHSSVALFFLDLSRFKDVNDTYGHHVGDLLLRQIAQRLKRAVRASDTVARLGGDEFAVVLPSADERTATMVAEKIASTLEHPFTVEGRLFEVGASIGIALYSLHGQDASTLMRHADAAMYIAKRQERSFLIYAPERDGSDPDRLETVWDLRAAIQSNDLLLHYQPQVNLLTGDAEQVEALVRWHHHQRGLIAPGVFIPLAEDHGLMMRLTEWVLREALRQVAEWREAGRDVRVAVNLSARTLHNDTLVEMVEGLLSFSCLSPSALLLEITESAIMLDPAGALTTLTRLHDLGVELSIDDFGTGYSSLSYLQHLPVDEIKVDRSFVQDMASNADNAHIVHSVIDLSHNLGKRVVAEGVEDAPTLEALTFLGCDLVQGYHLSRPVAADDYLDWLGARQARPRATRRHRAGA